MLGRCQVLSTLREEWVLFVSGMVAYAPNPSTWEAEAGELPRVSGTSQVRQQDPI